MSSVAFDTRQISSFFRISRRRTSVAMHSLSNEPNLPDASNGSPMDNRILICAPIGCAKYVIHS